MDGIIIILFLLIVFLLFFYLMKKYLDKFFDYLYEKNIYENYDKLIMILRDSEELAFRNIYVDDILVYHGSLKRLSNKEAELYGKKFARMTMDLCGEDVERRLKKMFGYETIMYRLLTSFKLRCLEIESNIEVSLDKNEIIKLKEE